MATHTVLVIEDEEDMIWTVEKVMEKVGYRTLSAKSGEDGLRLARESHPDVILLDIRLPRMSGYDVCRTLKSEPDTADLKVIFVTGAEEAEIFNMGAEVGADYYVPKPFFPDDLAVDLYYLFDRRFRITMEDRHLLRVARVIPKGQRHEPASVGHRPAFGGNVPNLPAMDATAINAAANASVQEPTAYPDQPITYDISPQARTSDSQASSKSNGDEFEEKLLREMRVFKQTIEIISKRLTAMEKLLQQHLAAKRM